MSTATGGTGSIRHSAGTGVDTEYFIHHIAAMKKCARCAADMGAPFWKAAAQ